MELKSKTARAVFYYYTKFHFENRCFSAKNFRKYFPFPAGNVETLRAKLIYAPPVE